MQTLEEFEAARLAVMRAEPSDEAVKRLGALMSCVGYTSTALEALIIWLGAEGDAEGAKLMSDFRREFASHEARTI